MIKLKLQLKSYETEIFGPVLQIIEVDSTEEGIKKSLTIINLEMVVVFLPVVERKRDFFHKCKHWNGRYKYTTSSSIIIS